MVLSLSFLDSTSRLHAIHASIAPPNLSSQTPQRAFQTAFRIECSSVEQYRSKTSNFVQRPRVGRTYRDREYRKERMNLRGCGRGLSHLGGFNKTETTRPFLSTRTTTTNPTYRFFQASVVSMTSKQEKWTAPVVRKTFLEFFEGKGHTVGMWRGTVWGEQNIFMRVSIALANSMGAWGYYLVAHFGYFGGI